MTLEERLKEIPGSHSEAAYAAIARIEELEAEIDILRDGAILSIERRDEALLHAATAEALVEAAREHYLKKTAVSHRKLFHALAAYDKVKSCK